MFVCMHSRISRLLFLYAALRPEADTTHSPPSRVLNRRDPPSVYPFSRKTWISEQLTIASVFCARVVMVEDQLRELNPKP